jgi:glycosyltransferase involved in cell wall biosynthesis
MGKPIRITHIINSFEFGGAESMLCNLVLRTERSRFEPSVVSLIDDLTVARPILDAGIPLAVMGIRPGVPDPRGVVRLTNHLRRQRPGIVQTWMDHSNLIGGLAARSAGVRHVVWGVHHSSHVNGVAKRSTLLAVSACAKLSSRVPSRVICCSEHARAQYSANGFDVARFDVIPNGFDTTCFAPDPTARAQVRRELEIDDATPVVGIVARWDPFKDHATFLRAAATLSRSRPGTRFILCGHQMTGQNAQLGELIASCGIRDKCHLLGPRRDVARVYAALDVLASSSISEAFPLALGESMSCGVPCAATDAGDSRLIVGDTGRIVPTRDPEALARACDELLALDAPAKAKLGAKARRRIQERFDLDGVTRRYEQVYERLLTRRARDGQAPAQPRDTGQCFADAIPAVGA